MGKFGIGARVRDEDGDIGEIVDKRKGERRVQYDPGQGFSDGFWLWKDKRDLTPIAANDDEPAQERGEPLFKVGDRVKLIDGEGDGRPAGSVGTVKEIWKSNNGATVQFDAPFKGWGDCGRCWNAPWGFLAAPEWQPKVGDRVRWKGESGNFYDKGSEHEILDESDGDFFYLTDSKGNRSHTWSLQSLREKFEPLPVAAVARGAGEDRADAGGGFKAGDRIRLIDFELPGMPLGSEFTAVARTSGSAGSVHFTDGNGRTSWRPGEYFELVKPLTIEAGKFYRTRDGRKVGPMEARREGWPFRGEIEGKSAAAFEADGKCPFFPDYDLVAEWVDEPASTDEVAVAPATATPATEQPAGKFKVGDRVRVKGSSSPDVYTVATRNSFGSMSLKMPGNTEPGLEWWDDDELEFANEPANDITTGALVTLATPATVTGFNGNNAHLSLATGGTYTLPRAALVPAA